MNDQGLHETPDPVVVFASGNYMDAVMVSCALNGHEVDSFVVDDNICRLYPQAALAVGGTKVMIEFEDLERASEVLELVFGVQRPFVGQFCTIPLSTPAAVISMLKSWFRRRPAALPD